MQNGINPPKAPEASKKKPVERQDHDPFEVLYTPITKYNPKKLDDIRKVLAAQADKQAVKIKQADKTLDEVDKARSDFKRLHPQLDQELR
jgi:hypothetical protein